MAYRKNGFWCSVILVMLLGCNSLGPTQETRFITGRAYLEGYDNHDGIRTLNVEKGDTTVTNAEGLYTLPMPDFNGSFTILAKYPFFSSARVRVNIQNKKILGLVRDLILHQAFEARVFTDRTVYTVSDTASVTIEVENVTDSVAAGIGFLFPSNVLFLSLSDSSVWALPWGPKTFPYPGDRDYQPGEVDTFAASVSFARCRKLDKYQAADLMPPGKYSVYSVPWPWIDRYSTAVRPAEIRIVPQHSTR